MPPAALSGASFPLAVRMVVDDTALVGAGVGRMSAVNTLGGIAGSLVIGLAILPRLAPVRRCAGAPVNRCSMFGSC